MYPEPKHDMTPQKQHTPLSPRDITSIIPYRSLTTLGKEEERKEEAKLEGERGMRIGIRRKRGWRKGVEKEDAAGGCEERGEDKREREGRKGDKN